MSARGPVVDGRDGPVPKKLRGQKPYGDGFDCRKLIALVSIWDVCIRLRWSAAYRARSNALSPRVISSGGAASEAENRLRIVEFALKSASWLTSAKLTIRKRLRKSPTMPQRSGVGSGAGFWPLRAFNAFPLLQRVRAVAEVSRGIA